MTISRVPPPLEYLQAASRASLQSFELTRLNHAANLRAEIAALIDQWIQETSEAMLARWMLDHHKLPQHSPISPAEPVRALANPSATLIPDSPLALSEIVPAPPRYAPLVTRSPPKNFHLQKIRQTKTSRDRLARNETIPIPAPRRPHKSPAIFKTHPVPAHPPRFPPPVLPSAACRDLCHFHRPGHLLRSPPSSNSLPCHNRLHPHETTPSVYCDPRHPPSSPTQENWLGSSRAPISPSSILQARSSFPPTSTKIDRSRVILKHRTKPSNKSPSSAPTSANSPFLPLDPPISQRSIKKETGQPTQKPNIKEATQNSKAIPKNQTRNSPPQTIHHSAPPQSRRREQRQSQIKLRNPMSVEQFIASARA